MSDTQKIAMDNFVETLKQKLQYELVGEKAHLRMIPKGRLLYPELDANPRKSAVLIAFYYHNSELYFPLIKRTTYKGVHSGQIALPGGKLEKTDNSLIDTALREANEEVGITENIVTVLGCLSEIYIGVTNISVLPVVGFLNSVPNYILEPTEVDELYPIKLSDLLNTKNKHCEEWDIRGERVKVPFYNLSEQKVWGATAMILSELEDLLTN